MNTHKYIPPLQVNFSHFLNCSFSFNDYVFLFLDDDWIQTHNLNRFNEINSSCLNVFSIIIFSVAFLIGQTILLVSWSLLCKRSSKMSLIDSENIYGSSNWSVRTSKVPPQSPHQQMNSTKNFNPYSSNELNQTYFTPQTRQNGPSFIYA